MAVSGVLSHTFFRKEILRLQNCEQYFEHCSNKCEKLHEPEIAN